MSNTYTYIISSQDGLNSGGTANSFTIMMFGLPSHIRRFNCVARSFVINIGSIALNNAHSLILTADNLITSNLYVSGNRPGNILAICDLNTAFNNNMYIPFVCDNFNGKAITFHLLNEQFNQIANATINQNTNTVWTLQLELTPLE